MTATSHTIVCHLDELPDPGSRGLTLSLNEQMLDVLIVRRGEQVFAYLNKCPHTGGPLDWVPDQFLSLDKNNIQCATHDALFRLDDGFCVAGPCVGDKLKTVPVTIDAGNIIFVHDDIPAGIC